MKKKSYKHKKFFKEKKRNNFIIEKKNKFLFLCFSLIYLYSIPCKNSVNIAEIKNEKIFFDNFETNKFDVIKQKLDSTSCSQMWDNQKEFLNGVIRKFKPKKVIELGVANGGSSIIILNAINDFENSKLYSLDLNSEDYIGDCVTKYFPQFIPNWKLFKGNIATEFIENIGNNIDIALIDTAHFEPGEILDFLIILPFLKEEAIVIFHDIANQITRSKERNEYAPYIAFNAIRGKKYLPSGMHILKHDIGAIKLEKNQKKYYSDYFRLLGGQWQYFPKEIHINQIINFIKKYYDNDCLSIFEDAVSFNRDFVKNNPKKILYKENSD